jgi:hypothetical protein
MNKHEAIKRVLRRGFGFGYEEHISEEQLQECAEKLSELTEPTEKDLERVGFEVAGNSTLLKSTDVKTLQLVLRELRGELAFEESPKRAAGGRRR